MLFVFKRRRHEMGLSQQDLANRAGLSLQTINQIERGRHRPRPRTLVTLAQALDWTPGELLDGLDADDAARAAAQ